MATPIAHKGAVAGAKVQALTLFDLMTKPSLMTSAKAYFNDVQTKDVKYQPFLRASDKPSIWLNKATMDKYRPEMKKYYYDAAKYSTYLEQLGIKYPTVRTDSSPSAAATTGEGAEDDGSLR
jgi:aminobenzoyl-glutamate utilization protein B